MNNPTDLRDVLRMMFMSLGILLFIGAVMLGASILTSCASMHPSDSIPDVVRMHNGHKWEGYRTRHKGTWMHARDCPHESHMIAMNPDTTYEQQPTTYPPSEAR